MMAPISKVVEHDHGRTSMTDAELAVALYFARNDSPEGHRIEALETQIAALKEAVSRAKATIELKRQEVAAFSQQPAEQSAANDELKAELDTLKAEFNAYWQRECRNYL
jgi:peptidoglycan hydrolase CwlO-like protein